MLRFEVLSTQGWTVLVSDRDSALSDPCHQKQSQRLSPSYHNRILTAAKYQQSNTTLLFGCRQTQSYFGFLKTTVVVYKYLFSFCFAESKMISNKMLRKLLYGAFLSFVASMPVLNNCKHTVSMGWRSPSSLF